jgi:hypothetical protein
MSSSFHGRMIQKSLQGAEVDVAIPTFVVEEPKEIASLRSQ